MPMPCRFIYPELLFFVIFATVETSNRAENVRIPVLT